MRTWTIRLGAGGGTPAEINHRMKELAALGAESFSLAAADPAHWTEITDGVAGDFLVPAPAEPLERAIVAALGKTLAEAVRRARQFGCRDIVLPVGLRALDDIAMLRAARRAYPDLRVHARTSEAMLDPLQPDVNLARVAFAAMAAALGGAASIEPAGIPARLGVRLLQMLDAETGVSAHPGAADGAEAIESRVAALLPGLV